MIVDVAVQFDLFILTFYCPMTVYCIVLELCPYWCIISAVWFPLTVASAHSFHCGPKYLFLCCCYSSSKVA